MWFVFDRSLAYPMKLCVPLLGMINFTATLADQCWSFGHGFRLCIPLLNDQLVIKHALVFLDNSESSFFSNLIVKLMKLTHSMRLYMSTLCFNMNWHELAHHLPSPTYVSYNSLPGRGQGHHALAVLRETCQFEKSLRGAAAAAKGLLLEGTTSCLMR